MAVAITRQDLSADDLRREAARSRDANAVRRLLAIALVLDGQSREDAAKAAMHGPGAGTPSVHGRAVGSYCKRAKNAHRRVL